MRMAGRPFFVSNLDSEQGARKMLSESLTPPSRGESSANLTSSPASTPHEARHPRQGDMGYERGIGKTIGVQFADLLSEIVVLVLGAPNRNGPCGCGNFVAPESLKTRTGHHDDNAPVVLDKFHDRHMRRGNLENVG
jgi:hypothetical protein